MRDHWTATWCSALAAAARIIESAYLAHKHYLLTADQRHIRL